MTNTHSLKHGSTALTNDIEAPPGHPAYGTKLRWSTPRLIEAANKGSSGSERPYAAVLPSASDTADPAADEARRGSRTRPPIPRGSPRSRTGCPGGTDQSAEGPPCGQTAVGAAFAVVVGTLRRRRPRRGPTMPAWAERLRQRTGCPGPTRQGCPGSGFSAGWERLPGRGPCALRAGGPLHVTPPRPLGRLGRTA
jgi:hypothetical protein